MHLLIKVISSAAIIGIITELARRFPVYGGMIAALPIISILSIIWLFVQGETNQHIGQFTLGVIAGIPATIVMLLIIYTAFKFSISLPMAILLGIIGWGLFVAGQKFITVAFFS